MRSNSRNLTLFLASAVAASVALGPAQAASQDDESSGGPSAREVGEAVGEVALTPLSDLNLRRRRIPEVLSNIRSPYQPIETRSCAAIGREIAELTEVLGADADEALNDSDNTGEVVRNTIGSTLSGLVLPFRGVVRAVSGAASRERQLRELHIRGVARRSYLKGVGSMLNCAPPAAPLPYVEPSSSS